VVVPGQHLADGMPRARRATRDGQNERDATSSLPTGSARQSFSWLRSPFWSGSELPSESARDPTDDSVQRGPAPVTEPADRYRAAKSRRSMTGLGLARSVGRAHGHDGQPAWTSPGWRCRRQRIDSSSSQSALVRAAVTTTVLYWMVKLPPIESIASPTPSSSSSSLAGKSWLLSP
jgi:hypothetical protein